jgi:endogenous inhibitor of DNA gyrase (YacG/DUF329 family)
MANDSINIKLNIKCPYCGKDTVFSSENIFRPFCSERCKMIDLGAWASEDFRIPSEEAVFLNTDEFSDENENS